ncbi:MAG: protein translocase subunit SecD, partial [Lachnospiraceae bacterium]|nr:protein translocase subunit SecD [Lachnospiraceae bacterium]
MKKWQGFLSLLVIIAALAGFGYLVMYGVDETGVGSAAKTKLGLDLAGGVSITYEVVGDETPSKEDMDDTVFKLRKRIDQYSTEANVYPEGNDRISIEIPGVTDANAILKDLGSPGSLYFIRALDPEGGLNYTNVLNEDGSYAYSEDNKPLFQLTKPIEQIVAEGSAVLSGTDVTSSEAKSYNNDYNQTEYIVSLQFSSEGSQKFADATGEAAGRSGLAGTIAIYYDNELLSVPNVQERIAGGSAQITGMRDFNEAQNLAQNIRIGGLKLELQELRSNVVGAQLGSDAIRTSLLAGLIGLILVILLMCVVYRIPGLASSIALVLYCMLVILCINLFEMTLTLPGIAGIILSVGMAVDANVIIFARIKEELRAGMTVKSAIRSGFSKALSAIIDGNITTLIAAFVLMAMGSGTIKGFAYTLAVGIVLSMFTALAITRMLVNAFYAIGIQKAKWYGLSDKEKGHKERTIDFLGRRKLFFGISLGVIAIGIIAMIAGKAMTGDALNYSLEFKGGTATTVAFDTAMSREEIEAQVIPELEKITGDANVQWQTVNDTNEVIFKTRVLNVDERQALLDVMQQKFQIGEEKITAETIGSTISGEMKKESLLAVAIAAVCMLIYIWFRFSDIRFGASAVCALLHDVLVVITFYALVRYSVSSTFIACMLTIVGYSINATIVIFDRVRENLHEMKRKDTLLDMVNRSVTQTLSRSIFTSLTTVIMVIMLFILGVSSIREFALPLIIGIVCGTYSSVCITGALWYVLREKFPPAPDEVYGIDSFKFEILEECKVEMLT